MTALMDLIAGENRDMLLALSVDDWAGFGDRRRFDAHLSLGGGLDPTWLDLFSEAVRTITGDDEPGDFLDARGDLEGPADVGERTVERVDLRWVAAVARIPDEDLGAVAGRWIELIEEELGALPQNEKPWIRTLVGDLIRFARDAEASSAVLFAWSL
jgi:hypothetical protein